MSKLFSYIIKKSLVLLCVAVLTGCALTYNPAIGRKEIVVIDTEQEVQLGRKLDVEIRNNYKISQELALKVRLNKIGQKVAGASDRKDLSYHFEVIEDKELNAFTIPGGFIYVNSGLMKEATDDELACILGHEIGHIAARHPVKRLEATLGSSILLGFILGRANGGKYMNISDTIFDLISLGYSREDERQADRLGIKYAYNADFDPKAMISFFNKLLKTKTTLSEAPLFLRTHPYTEERIKNVEIEIDKLKNPL